MISQTALAKILYEADPMGTSCNVNVNMEDEYDSEAHIIITMLQHCVPFETALHAAFNVMFTENCLVGNAKIPEIIAKYKSNRKR